MLDSVRDSQAYRRKSSLIILLRMCGRFTLRTPTAVLMERFRLSTLPESRPRYNISPTQDVLTIRGSGQGLRIAAIARWGLIPSWSKDTAIGAKMINARGETVAEKPSFRTPFRKRRCLVPADGYIEWRRQGTAKQPFLVELQEAAPFAMAGLWESWRGGDPTAAPLETFTIITTEANDLTGQVHDRMPVILSQESESLWLECDDPNPLDLLQLLVPYPADAMRITAVSSRVNNSRHDDPACLQVT